MSRRAKIVLLLTALGTLLGVIYAGLQGGGRPQSILRGVVAGLPISLGLSLFEAYVMDGPYGRWLRAKRFVVVLAARLAAWFAIIGIGLAAMRTALPIPDDVPIWGFVADLAYGFALVGVAIAYLATDRLLGRGNLWRLLTGRYHRPREEERIFLFLDMEGSTAAAERLGAARFLELLAACVLDATPALLGARGEIYRYVGDEIVVTWPMDRPGVADRALEGAIAALTALDSRAGLYESRFGVVPRFRGGLHGGTVAVGEIGDARREIVFLGDAVNVAKRLETAARDRGKRLVMSQAVAERLDDGAARARLEDLGAIALAGKSAPLRAFAMDV
jgi:adenylate cyclase